MLSLVERQTFPSLYLVLIIAAKYCLCFMCLNVWRFALFVLVLFCFVLLSGSAAKLSSPAFPWPGFSYGPFWYSQATYRISVHFILFIYFIMRACPWPPVSSSPSFLLRALKHETPHFSPQQRLTSSGSPCHSTAHP